MGWLFLNSALFVFICFYLHYFILILCSLSFFLSLFLFFLYAANSDTVSRTRTYWVHSSCKDFMCLIRRSNDYTVVCFRALNRWKHSSGSSYNLPNHKQQSKGVILFVGNEDLSQSFFEDKNRFFFFMVKQRIESLHLRLWSIIYYRGLQPWQL